MILYFNYAWKSKPISFHPGVITLDERLALEQHLTECSSYALLFADYNEANDLIGSAFRVSHPLELAEEIVVELKEEVTEESAIESTANLSILQEAERILARSWKELARQEVRKGT